MFKAMGPRTEVNIDNIGYFTLPFHEETKTCVKFEALNVDLFVTLGDKQIVQEPLA